MITIKVAGLAIGIDNRFEYITRLAADYLTDEPPLFTVRATDDDIAEEAKMTDVKFPDGYLESIVAYRKIAEILPSYDAFVFHGAVLNYDGRAVAFTAKSGVGKTTHTRLWRQVFGDRAVMVNDDKPFLRITENGVTACGSPWNGKHGLGANLEVPLQAVCILERGEENIIRPIPAKEAVFMLLQQSNRPQDPRWMPKYLELLDKLSQQVTFYRLACNMSPEAALVAYEAMGRK